MNKLLLLISVFTSLYSNAQEYDNKSFIKSFTKVIVEEFGNEKKKEEFNVKTTVVFNHGNGNDIKIYQGNESHILKSVSSSEEREDNNGYKYQVMKVLDEEGQEIAFMLYNAGFIRLVYYTDKGNILGDIFYIP